MVFDAEVTQRHSVHPLPGSISAPRYSTFPGNQSERSAISMKPRASSCFPCASPSVRFYSNPGWGPNSRQGLVKGTTHTPHERFPPGDCSFPATHKWDSSFKGGDDMLPLSAGPSADIRAATSQPTFFFPLFLFIYFCCGATKTRTGLNHVRHVILAREPLFVRFFFFQFDEKNIMK